ncbi:MAG: chromate transporter [Candidatus Syntrophosphaera sp.]|nr:chromate transporter [Candidatus Syntrophosphaera sp.]
MNRRLLAIFLTFLKIGAFTIGGAYAMIPLIRREVVEKRRWITNAGYLNGLAAAQSCPGPIAINLSVYIGFHVKRGWGVFAAVLSTVLPSLLIIIAIAALFSHYADLPLVRKAFHALKPAVVALIAVPLIQMTRGAGLGPRNFWLPLAAIILVGLLGVSPIYPILGTILYSLLQSFWPKKGPV